MTLIFDDFEKYVMHYTGHKDRKIFFSNLLKKENISVNWIEDYDREKLTHELIDESFDFSREKLIQKQYPRFFYYRVFPFVDKEKTKHCFISLPDISLCLKHKNAIKHFLENSDKKYMCIFEDDAILIHDFKHKLDDLMRSMPSDWDVCYIGHSGGGRITSDELILEKYWYKKSFPQGKGTDSMLFTKKAADIIYENLCKNKFSFPIDHEYTYILNSNNLNVYWLEPPIVSQGSQTGYFESYQPADSRYQDISVQLRTDMAELLNGE